MKRTLGGLVLGFLLLVQPAAFADGCALTGPESLAEGELGTFTGTGFTPGGTLVWLGSWFVFWGTATETGEWSVQTTALKMVNPPEPGEAVTVMMAENWVPGCEAAWSYVFEPLDDAPQTTLPAGLDSSLFTLPAWALVDADLSEKPLGLLVKKAGFMGALVVDDDDVGPYFHPATPLIVSSAGLLEPLVIDADDVEPAWTWEDPLESVPLPESVGDQPLSRWEAALQSEGSEVPGGADAASGPGSSGSGSGASGTDAQTDTTQAGDGTTDATSDGEDSGDATDTTTVGDADGTAAPVGGPDDGVSVILLGLVTGLGSGLIGLGVGWILVRRRS